MGKRLSKIYTRTGDDGTTGLGDGSRVPKDDERITAIGAVDELNSAIGMILAALPRDMDAAELAWTQHRIFDLGGELSIPGMQILSDSHTERLEIALDAMNEDLEPLANFILPAGSECIARTHMARSICRRAERQIVTLRREQAINEAGLRFVNRLSDYLFVLARHIARLENIDEVLWEQG